MSPLDALAEQLEDDLDELREEGEDDVKRYALEIATRVGQARASGDAVALASLDRTVRLLAKRQLNRVEGSMWDNYHAGVMAMIRLALRLMGAPA